MCANFQEIFLRTIKELDETDLQDIEDDLDFYELVSLGFLLYAEDRIGAEHVLQKLLVLANRNRYQTTEGNIAYHSLKSDLLFKYATTIDKENWRTNIVEALTIINANRILRKLDLNINELRQYYLPQIAEISVNIHPLLKALYLMSDRLNISESGRLILHINEYNKTADNRLPFHDFQFLEIFLLDWITCRIINIGDRKLDGANVDVLLEYFKLNDLDYVKSLLVDTIRTNTEAIDTNNTKQEETTECVEEHEERDGSLTTIPISRKRYCRIDSKEWYKVHREQAGFILIINQKDFYAEKDKDLAYLLPPKPLNSRQGTDVDKERLKEVFSSFGYKPIEYDNITHIELLNHVRETMKRSLLYDSLIVCILSHGIDGAIYGCNSIPVKISDIEKIITGDTLRGKPKMLIIQACQKVEEKADAYFENTAIPILPAADAYVDMIKAMSTISGHLSMRNTMSGTWYIQSLCDAVEELGDSKHMSEILVAVTRVVSSKRGENNEVMVPLTSSTLSKHFFLPPRTNIKDT